jgi:hypothetical protein
MCSGCLLVWLSYCCCYFCWVFLWTCCCSFFIRRISRVDCGWWRCPAVAVASLVVVLAVCCPCPSSSGTFLWFIWKSWRRRESNCVYLLWLWVMWTRVSSNSRETLAVFFKIISPILVAYPGLRSSPVLVDGSYTTEWPLSLVYRTSVAMLERLLFLTNGKDSQNRHLKARGCSKLLGAFAKLQKATISFVMSVRLSVSPSA